MTGGPEQSAGEERGDARLRAGRVRWQVGPERALRGSRPVWADRVREGVGLGSCWAERGRAGLRGWAKGERARAGPSAKAGRSGVRAGLGKVVWAGFGFEFCFGFSSYFLFLFYF